MLDTTWTSTTTPDYVEFTKPSGRSRLVVKVYLNLPTPRLIAETIDASGDHHPMGLFMDEITWLVDQARKLFRKPPQWPSSDVPHLDEAFVLSLIYPKPQA